MGRLVERDKAKRRTERPIDPHEWAYQIEKLADQRSIVGALAFFMALLLAANGWILWQANERLSSRIDSLEYAREIEVQALVNKYAPAD